MTKQTCLKILRERLTKAHTNLDKDYGYYHGIEVGLRQALEIIGMLTDLPESNELERAAEEYEDWAESYSQSDFPTCISFRQSFKAGAEWMAGQGVKLHGRILPGPRCNLYIESDCFDRGTGGLNYKFSDSNDVDMFVQTRK